MGSSTGSARSRSRKTSSRSGRAANRHGCVLWIDGARWPRPPPAPSPARPRRTSRLVLPDAPLARCVPPAYPIAAGPCTPGRSWPGWAHDEPSGPARPDATMQVIPADECYRLLASHEIGRHRGERRALPADLPGQLRAGRHARWWSGPHPGTILRAAEHANVTFEVDEIDRRTRSGWSVLVRGQAEEVGAEHRAELVARTRATGVRAVGAGRARQLAANHPARHLRPADRARRAAARGRPARLPLSRVRRSGRPPRPPAPAAAPGRAGGTAPPRPGTPRRRRARAAGGTSSSSSQPSSDDQRRHQVGGDAEPAGVHPAQRVGPGAEGQRRRHHAEVDHAGDRRLPAPGRARRPARPPTAGSRRRRSRRR